MLDKEKSEVVMKKFFLFFVIFMFFGVLTAQEEAGEQTAEENGSAAAAGEAVQSEEAVPAEVPAEENKESEAQSRPETVAAEPEKQDAAVQEEKTEEPEPEKCVCDCPTCPETKTVQEEEKPSKMFYQPSAGLGIGASLFSLRVNNDFDFLLKHTPGGTNVYMGLEVDFRYSPYLDNHSVYEIPIQLNMMFDFPVRHHNVKRLSLWFSAGIDLAFGYLYYYDYHDDNWDDGKSRDSMFKLMAAWGFGVNLLFHNDVTLKLGFDSFYGKYPDLICAAGYRF